MARKDKKTLFDEVKEALNGAGIVYRSASNFDGSLRDDRTFDAIEVFCAIVEKKITESELSIATFIINKENLTNSKDYDGLNNLINDFIESRS